MVAASAVLNSCGCLRWPHPAWCRSSFAKRCIARAKAKGKAEALLLVLIARGLPISQDIRERVLSCEDASALERWLERAVKIEATAELFG